MQLRKLLEILKSRKARNKQREEDNEGLHINFRSTIRQLVVVRSCLNEDGEASIELPSDSESPAPDGEEEEGGGHQPETEALNATAVLLVREDEIVSVALDVTNASTSGLGGFNNQHIGCGSSGSPHLISYRLTIFVSGGSDKTKMRHLFSSQTDSLASQGHKAAHPKASKAVESLWEKAGASERRPRGRWSATVKQLTHFFVTLNSSHEDPGHDFQLLGPVKLPEGKSWLSAIMEAPPDLEWVVLK